VKAIQRVAVLFAASTLFGQIPAGHPPLTSSQPPAPPAGVVRRAQPSGAAVPIRNLIDRHLFAKIQQNGVPHAALCTDEEFLRRLHLDLTGRPPEPAKITAFLADGSPDKRGKEIESILASPYLYKIQKTKTPFLDRWVYFFMDLFKIGTSQLRIGRNHFYDYLYLALLTEAPYDELVREMLTATARSNWVDAPSNFLLRHYVEDDSSPDRMNDEDSYDEIAIASTKYFLGIDLECVSCHDGRGHLEKINPYLATVRREQLWQQAAFFTQAKLRKPYLIDQEFSLLEKGKGAYDTKRSSVLRVPRYAADVTPRFLLTGEQPRPGEPWRQAYARMVTSHPRFAQAAVNLIWTELMGAGLEQGPYGAQSLHDELLAELGRDFSGNGFNLRRLIRTIVSSNAYQLSSAIPSTAKPGHDAYFAWRKVRRLPAETVADMILQATGTAGTIPVWRSDQTVQYVMQTRSHEDLRGADTAALKEFLVTFGQSNRDKGERDLAPSSAVAAEMMNGKFVRERSLIRKGGRLEQIQSRGSKSSAEEIVEELYLAFLSRRPDRREVSVATGVLAAGAEGLEDLAWALMNKAEFVYNR